MLISKALEKLKALGLPEGEYIVISSAVMQMHGLREANDLDVLVSDKVFADYRERYSVYVSGKIRIDEDIEFCNGEMLGLGSIEKRLNHAEYYGGIPFESIVDLLFWKENRGGVKNDADAKMIRKYLAEALSAQRMGSIRSVALRIIGTSRPYYGNDLLEILPVSLLDIGLTDKNTALLVNELEKVVMFPAQKEMAELLDLSANWTNDDAEKQLWKAAVNGDVTLTEEQASKRREVKFIGNLCATLIHQ